MPCGKKFKQISGKIPRKFMRVAKIGMPGNGATLVSEAQKIDQIKLGRKLRNAPRYPRKGF